MKRVAAILVVLAILGLIGWRLYGKLAKTAEGPQRRGGSRAVAIEVAPVTHEPIRDIAEFTGTLLPRAQFNVAPKVSGRLEKLMVNIGDPVRNGDLVAVLDSEEYAQQVAQAKAELEVGRANLAESKSALDIAGRDLERVKELRAQKVASESEYDEAEARYRAAEAKYQVAEAQIKQKEAALATTEVRLSYTRIQAAWEGDETPRFVAERFVDQGAMLRANDPIVSIVDLKTVIGVINVIERDFPGIKVGQTAQITTDAYPGRTFTGTLVRFAPVLKEDSRQARVEIEVPNEEGLLAPGMFIRASIRFAEKQDATIVPLAAIASRNGRQGVFLVDTSEQTARFVPVTLGIVNGTRAEVVDPPLEGMVVTLGHHLLEDGAAITLPHEEAPATAPSAAGEDTAPRRGGRPEAQK
jgi:RND family efflux transporter MFP subunit